MTQQYESKQCGGSQFSLKGGAQWRQALNAVILAGLVGLAGCQDSSSSGAQLYPAPFPSEEGGEPGNGQAPVDPTKAGLPSVNAGGDQAADPNVLILLNGDVEAASDARIASVSWTQVSGPSVQFLTPDQETTEILTPDVEVPTQLRFRLTATDEQGRVNSDTVALTVAPMPGILRVVGGTVNEHEEMFVFRVRLREALTEELHFRYRTQDGTAIAGEDYLPVDNEATIAAGETEVEISVVLLPDEVPEPHRYFFLKIESEVQGESIASAGTALILDDPNHLVVQGIYPDYTALKSRANLVVAPNGFNSVFTRDLTLRLNGETQRINPTNGRYRFTKPVKPDESYQVEIVGQPGRLSCAFGNGGLQTTITPSIDNTGLDVQCSLLEEGVLRDVVKVTVGDTHICALDRTRDGGENNHVTCWSSDKYFDYYAYDYSIWYDALPTLVPDLNNPIDLDAGEGHTCVIDSLETGNVVRCWGDNSRGQIDVPDWLVNPRKISAGGKRSCALDDHGVVCWGEGNEYLALSANGVSALAETNNTDGVSIPTDISVGTDHTCVIEGGEVICWGGRIEGGEQTFQLAAPWAIGAGNRFSCALHNPGDGAKVACWDENRAGEPAEDVSDEQASMRRVALAAAVKASDNNSFSSLEAPGYFEANELAIPEDILALNPVGLEVAGDLACVIHNNSEETAEESNVACWFPKEGVTVPTLAGLGGSSSIGINGGFRPMELSRAFDTLEFPGEFHATVCGISDGRLKCRGDSNYTTPAIVPVPVVTGATVIVAGYEHACAQGVNGVSCWGWSVETPELSVPDLLTAGSDHNCAVDRETDEVICWGRGYEGESLTYPVEGLAGVSALGASYYYSCALSAAGVRCWDFQDPLAQLDVPELAAPFALASGESHVCVLQEESTPVKCWAYGEGMGELEVPGNLVDPQAIVAGDYHTCVLDESRVKCWGEGYDGFETPVLASPHSLFATGDTTCVTDNRGVLCWDSYYDGEPELVDDPDESHPFGNLRSIAFGEMFDCYMADFAILCNRYEPR